MLFSSSVAILHGLLRILYTRLGFEARSPCTQIETLSRD